MTKASAKQGHAAKMWAFLTVQLGLFLSLNAVLQDWRGVFDSEARWVLAVAPIAVLVLNGIVPSGVKASLVFWRLKHPLPACRAFSHHIRTDPRIDTDSLQRIYGSFPKGPEDQNRLWYRMYKSVESAASVHDAQSSYLLARDLTVASLAAAVLFAPTTLVLAGWRISSAIYIAFLGLQYILLMLAARNYATRFVCNALAEASVRN